MSLNKNMLMGHNSGGGIVGPSISEAGTRCMETIELTSKNDHMFNTLSTKRKYFKKLRKIYKKYGNVIFRYDCNEMLLHEHIEMIKNSTDMTTTQFLTVEVIQENGKDILIVKRKNSDDPIIQVLSAEDCFSVILKAHRESMHGNAIAIRNITQHNYRYPLFCIPLVLQTCNVCKEVSKSFNVSECTALETNKSVWKLAIHKMQKNKNFVYLFIYVEVVTAYTLIRPLTKLSVEELGMQLMKIFTTFGPPKRIITTKDYEFLIKNTMNMMAVLDLSENIKVDICQDYIFDVNSVIMLMKKYFKQTGSKDWVTACGIVQWQLNTSLRVISERGGNEIKTGIPYNLFYGSKSNIFNHNNGNIVSEQLSFKFRNPIILELPGNRKSKTTSEIVDLSSDDDADESSACCVCNSEFAMYDCQLCAKPIHYKCGFMVPLVEGQQNVTRSKILCQTCWNTIE